MKGGRGIHTKPNNGKTNEWLTPPEIVSALGKFDLDPCAHPQQFYRTAAHMVSPPADGLSVDWSGQRVWLNPPYGSELKKWLAVLANGTNFGTAIVPARTEVENWFWPFIWESASAILFLRGRLYFRRPDGTTAGNAGHGSVLAAYGRADADAIKSSGIKGQYFPLKPKRKLKELLNASP